MYTLNSIEQHAVYAFDSLSSNSMKSKNPHSGCRKVEVSKTLDCFDPNPSKNQGGIAVVERCAGFKAGQSMAGSLGYEDEISPTLSAMPSGLEPTVVIMEMNRLIYDARGNGDGMISPTITGDHQDRITDYTAILVECYAKPGFDRYVKQDISDTIRASGGDAGGGSEMLIVTHESV